MSSNDVVRSYVICTYTLATVFTAIPSDITQIKKLTYIDSNTILIRNIRHLVKGNTINHFYDCNVQYGSDSIAIRVQGDPTKFSVLVFLKVDLHLDIG